VLAADDPEAFGVFYDRHVLALLGFFYRRTACAESAADLTAETFAAAFVARRRYRDLGAPARARLIGIGRRKLARSFRYAEVARRLGCSEGAARVRVARALAKLEALLEVAL
jgi:RNA polymerase sigma-70 factor (ECF subfamily)